MCTGYMPHCYILYTNKPLLHSSCLCRLIIFISFEREKGGGGGERRGGERESPHKLYFTNTVI